MSTDNSKHCKRDHECDSYFCERCKKRISESDIRAYRSESGDDSLPAMCSDCAEIEE